MNHKFGKFSFIHLFLQVALIALVSLSAACVGSGPSESPRPVATAVRPSCDVKQIAWTTEGLGIWRWNGQIDRLNLDGTIGPWTPEVGTPWGSVASSFVDADGGSYDFVLLSDGWLHFRAIRWISPTQYVVVREYDLCR